MVQPYVRSVDSDGESALLFFDGELSHAICKGPMLSRESAVRSELAEPSPFLDHAQGAADRLVAASLRRATR